MAVLERTALERSGLTFNEIVESFLKLQYIADCLDGKIVRLVVDEAVERAIRECIPNVAVERDH